MTPRAPVFAALAAVCALTGACALLATPEPVQLYRFGSGETAPAPGVRAGAPIEVMLRPIEFDPAARGDRILAVTGAEAAYLAGARWVSPAETLFVAALENAFSVDPGRVRLSGMREATPGVQSLDVDVLVFEARYPSRGAAPTATVVTRVRLLGRDRSIRAEQTFTTEHRADDNRVSAIVAAFDAASAEAVSRIVAWTEIEAARN